METLCNGRGSCQDIAYWATQALNSDGAPGGFTYGNSNTEATWDKNSIKGCFCTQQYYGRMMGNAERPFGHDCALLNCPTGDNPETINQYHETQTIKCQATGGSFTVSFRSVVSSAIAWNANAATIESTLSELSSVYRVLHGGQYTVSVTAVLTKVSDGTTSTAACSSSGVCKFQEWCMLSVKTERWTR